MALLRFFFAIFTNLQIAAAEYFGHISNETAATLDNSQTRLKYAFRKMDKGPPFKNRIAQKESFELLKRGSIAQLTSVCKIYGDGSFLGWR